MFITDEQELFAANEYSPGIIALAITHGVPATVPCLVTDPEVNVTLINSQGKPLKLDSTLTYDPKIGFNMFFPNVHLSGLLTCSATLGNTSQDLMAILTFVCKYLS